MQLNQLLVKLNQHRLHSQLLAVPSKANRLRVNAQRADPRRWQQLGAGLFLSGVLIL